MKNFRGVNTNGLFLNVLMLVALVISKHVTVNQAETLIVAQSLIYPLNRRFWVDAVMHSYSFFLIHSQACLGSQPCLFCLVMSTIKKLSLPSITLLIFSDQ